MNKGLRTQSFGQSSINDHEYLILSKVILIDAKTESDKLNALMDLELIDHAMALMRTDCLMSKYTDKGNKRRGRSMREQLNNLLDHDIKERYEMGIMPRRFWLTDQWDKPAHTRPPFITKS